jgi:hypothetical protein
MFLHDGFERPKTNEQVYRVLNLGAGVQSTCLYLMYMHGYLEPNIKFAIFADTGDEPIAVYRHLEWLISLNGPTILVRSRGRKLGDDLLVGRAGWGTPQLHEHHKHRFASIPAFTAKQEGVRKGMTRRQCSKEYKVEVIERSIRRDVLGLAPKRTALAGTIVYQSIGISLDEAGRAARMMKQGRAKYLNYQFPLIEASMTRSDCIAWLTKYGNVPHPVPRSACVYCPYHTDAEWLAIKSVPEDWQRAVEVDEGLRAEGAVADRGLNEKLYVHRECRPLVQIQFNPKPTVREAQTNLNFNQECTGVCGV